MSTRPDLACESSEDLSEAEEWLDGGEGSAEAPLVEARVDAAGHGQRLDVFLVSLAPQYSRSYLKGLVEQGCVRLDGAVILTASKKVGVGQVVQAKLLPTPQSQAFVAQAMPLDVVFEDAHLLVVNKPAGLVVHPAAGNWSGTLMNGLLAHHAGAAELPRAGIVHRLDKDTSGLMVVGKTLVAVTALTRAIAAREVSRQYLALVHGHIGAPFSVDAPIGRDPATRVRMAVLASGKEARTDVEPLVLASFSERGVTRSITGVRCTLHTGRTHQIRVHLSHKKHPLVADAVYGGAPALGLLRQALHACRLALVHPVTGQAMVWQAALPADMASAWDLLAPLQQNPNRGA